MLQRITFVIAVLLLPIVGYNTYRIESKRLAYVDSTKLLAQYKGMSEARTAYQKKAANWRAHIDTLSIDVQSAIRRYERSVATMSAKEQGLARQLIEAKQKQLVEYQKTIQQTAQEEDVRSTQAVLQQVNAFLDTYGKTHNYDLILVANQTGNIAYARVGLDITDEIAEALNSKYLPGK